jgi:hypothetical protein
LNEPTTIFLAGGGTGGHLYPGIAVAESLRAKLPDCKPVFLCTQKEIDRVILEAAGFEFVPQPIVPPVRTIGGLLKFWKSWRETQATSSSRRSASANPGGGARAGRIRRGRRGEDGGAEEGADRDHQSRTSSPAGESVPDALHAARLLPVRADRRARAASNIATRSTSRAARSAQRSQAFRRAPKRRGGLASTRGS